MIIYVRSTLFAIALFTASIFAFVIRTADSTPVANVYRQVQVSSSDDFVISRRTRSLLTTGAIQRLLGTTKRMFDDGLNKVFAKKGNIEDAIRDFMSLNPSDVNGITKDRHSPIRVTGKVDNLNVVVQEQQGRITLDIVTTLKKDPLSHHKQKRSPRQNAVLAVKIGTEAIEKLLRKTKLLYTNGYDQVLVKAGGYKQALSDFKSIDPDVMKETKTEVLGSKGNLDIKLQDGELPKMTFTSRSLYQSHFLDKPPEYIIFYQPKLSKNK